MTVAYLDDQIIIFKSLKSYQNLKKNLWLSRACWHCCVQMTNGINTKFLSLFLGHAGRLADLSNLYLLLASIVSIWSILEFIWPLINSISHFCENAQKTKKWKRFKASKRPDAELITSTHIVNKSPTITQTSPPPLATGFSSKTKNNQGKMWATRKLASQKLSMCTFSLLHRAWN